MNWAKAKEVCQDLGAKLVEIDSAQENEAIIEEMKKQRKRKQFWMGLTKNRKIKNSQKNENNKNPRSDRQAARGTLCT